MTVSLRKQILFGLLLFLVMGLWSSLAGRLWQHASASAYIGSTDNDSAAAIEVGARANIFQDTGWRTYGPIYYKVQSLLRMAFSWDQDPELSDPDQARERKVHFFLMLISGLALFAFAFGLSTLITENNLWRLSFVCVFVPVLLQNDTRVHILILAKPDVLFGLLMSATFLWLLRWQNTKNTFDLKVFSFLLGLTAATKLAILYFAPALLISLIWILWEESKSLKTAPVANSWKDPKFWKLFVGFTAMGYFLPGLPETWDVRGTIEYLVQQNKNSSLGNLDSIKVWTDLIAEDLWRPSLVIALFTLLSDRFRNSNTKKPFTPSLKLGWVFVGLAYSQILIRKIVPPFEWYPLPMNNCALIMLALSLRNFKSSLLPLESAFLLPFALPFFIPTFTPEMTRMTTESRKCFDPARRTFEQAVLLAKQQLVLVDALVPFPKNNPNIDMAWDMTWSLVQEKKATALILREDYFRNYLTRADGGMEIQIGHVKSLQANREFYRSFFKKSSAVDPNGIEWKKVQQFDCDFAIWQRSNELTQ